MLTKDEVLAANDLCVEEVEIPEWGGTVRVRELNVTNRDQLEAFYLTASETKDFKGLRALVASMSVIDADGEPMFTAEELAGKSGAAIDRIYDAVIKMSHMRQSDLDDMVKNSESEPVSG